MNTFNKNLIEITLGLVQETDKMNNLQKMRAQGVINSATEKLYEEIDTIQMIKDVAKVDNVHELVSYTSGLITYTTKEKDEVRYHAIYYSDKYGKWVRLNRFANTLEELIIGYVAVKFDGENTKADYYFTKMINMYPNQE